MNESNCGIMKKKVYTIGRENCDICLWDETNEVSRHHAQIRIDDKGKYWLTDMSTNGTYVNGIRITPHVEVMVNRDDEISFARIERLDWEQIPKVRIYWKWLLAVGVLLTIIAVGVVCWFTLPISDDKGVPEPIPEPKDLLDPIPEPKDLPDPINEVAEEKVEPKVPVNKPVDKKVNEDASENKEEVENKETNNPIY